MTNPPLRTSLQLTKGSTPPRASSLPTSRISCVPNTVWGTGLGASPVERKLTPPPSTGPNRSGEEDLLHQGSLSPGSSPTGPRLVGDGGDPEGPREAESPLLPRVRHRRDTQPVPARSATRVVTLTGISCPRVSDESSCDRRQHETRAVGTSTL